MTLSDLQVGVIRYKMTWKFMYRKVSWSISIQWFLENLIKVTVSCEAIKRLLVLFLSFFNCMCHVHFKLSLRVMLLFSLPSWPGGFKAILVPWITHTHTRTRTSLPIKNSQLFLLPNNSPIVKFELKIMEEPSQKPCSLGHVAETDNAFCSMFC